MTTVTVSKMQEAQDHLSAASAAFVAARDEAIQQKDYSQVSKLHNASILLGTIRERIEKTLKRNA